MPARAAAEGGRRGGARPAGPRQRPAPALLLFLEGAPVPPADSRQVTKRPRPCALAPLPARSEPTLPSILCPPSCLLTEQLPGHEAALARHGAHAGGRPRAIPADLLCAGERGAGAGREHPCRWLVGVGMSPRALPAGLLCADKRPPGGAAAQASRAAPCRHLGLPQLRPQLLPTFPARPISHAAVPRLLLHRGRRAPGRGRVRGYLGRARSGPAPRQPSRHWRMSRVPSRPSLSVVPRGIACLVPQLLLDLGPRGRCHQRERAPHRHRRGEAGVRVACVDCRRGVGWQSRRRGLRGRRPAPHRICAWGEQRLGATPSSSRFRPSTRRLHPCPPLNGGERAGAAPPVRAADTSACIDHPDRALDPPPPPQVESALVGHHLCAEAAVVPIDHEIKGQVGRCLFLSCTVALFFAGSGGVWRVGRALGGGAQQTGHARKRRCPSTTRSRGRCVPGAWWVLACGEGGRRREAGAAGTAADAWSAGPTQHPS